MTKKVMGKFGANSKLSNTITLEPDTENQQPQDGADIKGKSLSHLSTNFRTLVEYCLKRNETYDEPNLEKIVTQTFDLCFSLENECEFHVHQVIFLRRCFCYSS